MTQYFALQGIFEKRKTNKMNTLLITLGLAASMMINAETTSVSTEVKQKIEESLTLTELKLPLEANQTGLVRASLKVNENGKLEIVEANYSDEKLKEMVATQLSTIDLEGKTTNEVFYYTFYFEKL